MRALLSIASLLLVLAIVGLTLKQQLRSAPPAVETSSPASAGAPDFPAAATPQQQVKQVQEEVQRAMEQGAARASQADQ
jgi:hypothetical protein